MLPADLISAVTAVFIVGMVWLRTRMHYRRDRGGGRPALTRAGRIYFAVLLAVLICGWFAAPTLGRTLWPGPMTTALLTRVVWFLAAYYLFIPVHRALRSRGVEVFKVPAADLQGGT
jgi:hypothetical protein